MWMWYDTCDRAYNTYKCECDLRSVFSLKAYMWYQGQKKRRLFLFIILQNIHSSCSSSGSYVEHPVKLLNGPCGEMICSAAVEKVKTGLDGETAAAGCGWVLLHWPATTEVLCRPLSGCNFGEQVHLSYTFVISFWLFCIPVFFSFHLIQCISSSFSSSFVSRSDSSFVCFQVWRNPYICRKFAQLRNELTYTLYLCGDYN